MAPARLSRDEDPRRTMLTRTADNLFWFARYMERADYVARIVQVTLRLAALPTTYGARATEWESALESTGEMEAYMAGAETVEAGRVIHFLVFDETNPSSIVSCVEQARTNARAVRTALTIETWETINTGWLEMRRVKPAHATVHEIASVALASFLDMILKLAIDVDGSAYRTMLRNDAYWFMRLGLYIERADNTARMLDVKYNLLLPESEEVGGSIDYFQWTAILRAVSALTAYNWIYREGVKPWLIADLLILRAEMPRSLISCYGEIVRFLDAIARSYGRQGLAQRRARQVLDRLERASIRQVFNTGLHEFITEFVEDNHRLGVAVTEQFLQT